MNVARLQPRAIRGRLADVTGTGIASNPSTFTFTLYYEWDSSNTIDGCGCFNAARSYDASTGSFEIRNVAPGSYKLKVSRPDATQQAALAAGARVLDPTRVDTSTEAFITVGDSDIENVILTFPPLVPVTGKMTVEGQPLPPAPPQRLRLQYQRSTKAVVDSIGSAAQASVLADGAFRLEVIQPGEYRVSAVGVPATHYVKTLQFNGQDLLSGPMLLSDSAGSGIALVLSSDVGQVKGVVTDAAARPVGGVPAVIVPETKRPDLYRNVATDQNGQFTFSGVAPGEYRVFAWDGMEPFRYFDPDFMKLHEARGKSIRVTAATVATADVQVIPVE